MQARRETMVQEVVLWALRHTKRFHNELTRSGLRDGFASLGTEVPGKIRVTILAATTVTSFPRFVLFPA